MNAVEAFLAELRVHNLHKRRGDPQPLCPDMQLIYSLFGKYAAIGSQPGQWPGCAAVFAEKIGPFFHRQALGSIDS